ncbi:hypothetical protein [Streptomyces sp. NPDC051214]|uniref:hypothetical protein n=1 Tax=Streptomyces sp. NPDC051214 TaxID=3155282 RepID=UPI0034481538
MRNIAWDAERRRPQGAGRTMGGVWVWLSRLRRTVVPTLWAATVIVALVAGVRREIP